VDLVEAGRAAETSKLVTTRAEVRMPRQLATPTAEVREDPFFKTYAVFQGCAGVAGD
jgi:hypothetical protein